MLRAAAIRLDRDRPFDGFTVTYDQDELQFPVFVLMLLTGSLAYASLSERSIALLTLSVFLGAFAFYNFPLLETGRIRLAANSDSLFIDGLGRVGWRFIQNISLAEVIMRGNSYKEADICLSTSLPIALSDDARNMPLHRRLMRKPFYLTGERTIRVPLEIFDRSPDDVIDSLLRTWIYNRAKPIKGSFG
ncbi:MAG: hypothetical protein QM780_11050 [Hyphomicrobium sp.]|uniref:hypothetical protein n=1 Tax=Hyphomicrobium sp. TaxID=82 RepID=UPI0039E5A42C